MASRSDLTNIASVLRRLVETSPQTADGVEAWAASAREADAQIRTDYPHVELPSAVMQFMHDADIRVKDQAMRNAQLSAVRDIISCLERGEVPGDRSATIRVSLRGAIIGAGLIFIVVILGIRSCA